MATSSTYYIDSNNFSTATSVYTDVALSIKAPDGFYSFSGIYRKQLFGKLQSPSNCTSEGNGNIRINYIVNLFGGISYGSFNILVNGVSFYSTTSDASGYIEVAYDSVITAEIYAPIGDTSGNVPPTYYTRVLANDSNGVLADSGTSTSNSYASITFNAVGEISIQADGSVSGGSGGEGPQVN